MGLLGSVPRTSNLRRFHAAMETCEQADAEGHALGKIVSESGSARCSRTKRDGTIQNSHPIRTRSTNAKTKSNTANPPLIVVYRV